MPATVNSMMGGYGTKSAVDERDSCAFLDALRVARGAAMGNARALGKLQYSLLSNHSVTLTSRCACACPFDWQTVALALGA